MNNEAENTTALATRENKSPMMMGQNGIQFSEFDSLFRFSKCVADSGLAPKGIQTPQAIAVAIQMGLEVGLSPMTALQNIAVINGRPAIWGDAQLAIVRNCGHLERFEEAETNNISDLIFRELCLTDGPGKNAMRIALAKAQSAQVKTADDFGVTVFVQRRGFEPTFGRFTIGDAKVARLWGKEGPWTQYPTRMLRSRARSFLLRDNFGDALKGLMTAEEAQEMPAAVERAKPKFTVTTELTPPAALIEEAKAETEPPPAAPRPSIQDQLNNPEPRAAKASKATSTPEPLAGSQNHRMVEDWMRRMNFDWTAVLAVLVENQVLGSPESKPTLESLSDAQAGLVWKSKSGVEAALVAKEELL